jgi:hypothetical protein
MVSETIVALGVIESAGCKTRKHHPALASSIKGSCGEGSGTNLFVGGAELLELFHETIWYLAMTRHRNIAASG